MNKAIKNMLFSFFIFMSFFFSITWVSANTIKKIDMDIYIDANGNAMVTEIWDTYLSEGTEGYRPYTNLGNSSITNFSVSDDSGRTYDVLSSWNTSASFDNKVYKSGIHYITDGVELCWGISNYGNRIYTLKYDVSNFVTEYTDTQGIYFNFLKLDQSIGSAKITIHSDIPFSLDNARIWAFGYKGTDVFDNGSIILDSNGLLSTDQYMVGLIRFESNLFNTSNKSSSSFDDIYDSAFNDVNRMSIFTAIRFAIVLIIFNPFLWLIVFAIIMFNKVKVSGKNLAKSASKNLEHLSFGASGKTLPSDEEINYWREIPCNKDLERAHWVCSQYNVVSEKTLNQGIIGAILLKWIRNGYVTVSKTKKGLFSIKDNNYAIDFTKMTHADNEIENDLFKMLVSASGFNKILEAKEFSKWSKQNYAKVKSWFSTLNSKEKSYLEKQGLITSGRVEETEGTLGKRTVTVKNVSPKLREDAIQMKGLRKFLLDFSMMPEREYFEVHIWEEYLIFAQLLGIADKVAEQFSKLYPKFNQVTQLDPKIASIVVSSMAEICCEALQAGFIITNTKKSSSNRDYSGTSRESGGGGSSYSSGGSSSGGSSGGGFR